MDIISYLLARSYVKKTLAGVGAIKGKPCQIQNIEPITGGNRVTFLWVDNSNVEHTSTMDVMNGLRGEQGLQGIQGPQGPAGVAGPQGAQGAQGIAGAKGDKGDKGDTGNTGAKGDDGVSATIRIGNVTSGESVSVNNVGTNTDAVFDFTLPKGDKGDKGDKGEDGADGKSFEIKARFQTEQELIAAYPDGPDNPSDAYFVGTTTSPDLYTWLSDDHEWFNNGPIAGVKGDKGDTGDDGFSPVASVSKSGKVVTISIRDKVGQTTTTVNDGEDGAEGKSAYEVAVDEGFVGTEAEWLASLVGPQGIQGPQGLQGIQGEQGIQGPVGPAGAGLPEGGTTGQTLTKRSATDYDYEWTSLGTAATKDANGVVRPTETRLVDGNAVASAINQALTSVYQPRESIYCADLTSELLIEENVNGVYEMLDSGTTSALFVQGAGITINQYDNVGVIKAGPNTIMFNYMGHALDLHDYQKKDLASAIEGATTVEGALNALFTNKATQTEVNDIVNVLGAKNLFDGSVNTTTAKGVTFTQNADGTISVTGSNTQGSSLGIFANHVQKLKAGSYILSGCPSPTSGGLHIQLSNNDAGVLITETYDGNEASFTLNADTNCKIMYWGSGDLAITGTLVISPMIRLASDLDNTYEPYAMTNQQMTPYVQAISNPNLLDNPWFTVNQRGQSSYTPTKTDTYTVDRWRIETNNVNHSVTINNDGTITLTNTDSSTPMYFSIVNALKEFVLDEGTYYTASVNVVNYSGTTTVYGGLMNQSPWTKIMTGVVNSVGINIFTGIVPPSYGGTSPNFRPLCFMLSPNSSITIKAVKLELGSVSTLAMDTAPNFQQELAKCQRYFVRYAGAGYPEICHAVESSSTSAWGLCFLPVPMRTKPSVTFANVNAYRLSDDSATAITAMAIHALANNACKIMFTLASNGQNGAVVEIQPNSNSNGYVDFSADL